MANIKVSEMPETTSANIDDLIMIIQGGGNKKITEKNLLGDRVVVSPTEPTGDNRKKVWFRWSNNYLDIFRLKTRTTYGITFTPTATGIKITGTAQDTYAYGGSVGIDLKKGKTYTLYGSNAGNTLKLELKKGTTIITAIKTSNNKITFTPNDDINLVTFVLEGIVKGTTYNYEISNLQIEQGDYTSYETYVEPQIFIRNSNGVYEEFIKKNGEIILYENQDGNTGYEIELLDTVTKCAEVEIYGIGDNNIRIYQKILNPNQATFEMSSEVMYEGTEYINKALCAFINNKFYKYQDREYKIDVTSANVRNVTTSNWLKIVKIVGILN